MYLIRSFLLLFALLDIANARLGETFHFRALKKLREKQNKLERRAGGSPYPEQFFSVPIDHFKNDSMYEPHEDGKFDLRYWFDASNYKAGGPVFLFEGGEADATSRWPILQKGIIYQLAKAMNGVGVVIEHRYYGKSQPMPDSSTKNLRFLTTAQAMADNAYFAQNIVFPGMEQANLTSHDTAWFHYGGSYSGAFVAIAQKLYPDVFWGAISSSGVTKAIWNYKAYFNNIIKYGPPQCIKNVQELTNAMDNILMKPKNKKYKQVLKDAFGFTFLEKDYDFVSTLAGTGIYWWQSKNWDPEVNYDDFHKFCLDVGHGEMNYKETAKKKKTVEKLLEVGGYGNRKYLVNPMLNWIGYVDKNVISRSSSQEELRLALDTSNAEALFANRSPGNQEYLSWPYQYCTQWGFLQTGEIIGKQLPIISQLIDLEAQSAICRQAFNITKPADTYAINQYGGYRIAAPRLAIIDGQADPWRDATPHAEEAKPWNRPNTAEQPFHMIGGHAVHHWDENGVFPNETRVGVPPKPVADAQSLEVQWVQSWLLEYWLTRFFDGSE